MRRFLQVMAIVGLSMAMTSASEANGPGGTRGGRSTSHSSGSRGSGNSHGHNSHQFNSYRGRDHHWSSWYWNSRYNCYQYYCPTAQCYYYWYAPTSCYYPVSYINEYPPTQVQYSSASPGAAPLPVVQVTNVNQNSLANGVPTGPLAAAISPGGPISTGSLPPGPVMPKAP